MTLSLPRPALRTAVLPGLLAAAAVAAVATGIGRVVPLLGAPVAAVLLGTALSHLARRRPELGRGLAAARGTALHLAVVLLGAQLSLQQAASLGVSSLPVMAGTLTVCLALAWLLGRRLGIGRDLRTLIGVGTAICGASAIAAVSPVIKARNHDVAYALSTIFLCNVAAVLTFPPLGHLLGLSQNGFGLFAGTAVNDTSSVVAAASTYGTVAAGHAIAVKLTRSLMIIPICLVLAATARDRSPGRVSVTRLVPWFLIGFVVLAAVHSIGAMPAAVLSGSREAALLLITLALAGIGLSTDAPALRRAGARPLLLGVALWAAVAATSLLLQTVAG